MSVPALTSLEQMQADVTSRVLNDPFLSQIKVYSERKGVSDADLENTLATMTRAHGKKGAAIIVGDIPFDVRNPAAPGPQIEPYLYVRCIERPLVNRAPNSGSMITSEAMAIRIVRLLHNFQIQNLGITLTAKAGDPIIYKDGEREYAVRLEAIMQLQPLQGCAYPVITGTAAAVTITCATPDATIYYTTDGSTPGPENDNALIFGADTGGDPIEDSTGDTVDDSTDDPIEASGDSSSFAVVPGTLVRAVAFHPPNLVASNLAAKTIH